MPVKSEIYDIPGNAEIDPEERDARINEIYVPFRDAIANAIAERARRSQQTVLVTIHSFTPVFRGIARSVEIGILHDADSRLADAMLAAASDHALYDIRRNEPYGPTDGVTHTLKEHGQSNGLLNVMIEVRNDLIRDEVGQGVVADYLTGLLRESLQTLS